MLKYTLTIDPEEGGALLEIGNNDRHYQINGSIAHITQAMFKIIRLDLAEHHTMWEASKPEGERYADK